MARIKSGLGKKVATTTWAAINGIPLIAGPNANVELYKPIAEEGATVRTNVFYNIGNTKGYTWSDFGTEGGYFGKSTFTTPVSDKASLKTQVVHGNEPFTQAGIGATANVPYLPKGFYANVGVVPFWMNKNAEFVKDKAIASYYISASLPKGLLISSFGEANVFDRAGPTWSYGEIDISKQLTEKLNVGFNIPMTSKGPGKITPEIKTARLKVQYSLGGK